MNNQPDSKSHLRKITNALNRDDYHKFSVNKDDDYEIEERLGKNIKGILRLQNTCNNNKIMTDIKYSKGERPEYVEKDI